MMRKYEYKVTALLILMSIVLAIAFSGCINSPAPDSNVRTPTSTPIPTPIPTPQPIAYGYITTIVLDKMETELIKIDDNYDKYEVENNVGTVNYRGYTYQTHKVILWKDDTRKTVNNVIEYELTKVIKSSRPELKVYGSIATITLDKMETELVKINDNYDKFDVEENVGTVSYRGYTYQTHRVTLWKGDTKRIINTVVEYHLMREYI